MPPSSHHLQSRINNIYDHLYANSAVKTPAGIAAEVGKILHVGMFVEEIDARRPAFRFDKAQHRSLLAQDQDLCAHFARIAKEDFQRMNDRWNLYPGKKPCLGLSNLDIGYVIAKLDDIYLSDPSRDVFGDVVEIIRSNWAKRLGGQFFTDQRVTSLAMTLLRFDPRKGDDLVDLCAGTGGFLLAAVNHIRGLLEAQHPGAPVEEELIKLAVHSVCGYEIDAEVVELGNASLTTRLGTLPKSLISHQDSLRLRNLTGDDVQHGQHLCAASNPPFGASITVRDPSILADFDLAQAKTPSGDLFSFSSGKVAPRPPDVLFLEQNLRLLKPGLGRLAIVLPYQILSGPQTLYVREWLLRHARILAVIDLPAETFQPHTGTKTSLLLVQRREQVLASPVADETGNIFMAMPKWIGHDRRGNPVFKRSEDGSETDVILSDFPEVATAFNDYVDGGSVDTTSSNSFVISYKALISDPLLRANALFFKPMAERSQESVSAIDRKREWSTVKVRDVVGKIFYPGRFKRNYVEWEPDAVQFFGGANITELVPISDKWLRHNDPKLQDLTIREGWILITRSGSTGIISSVPKAWDGCAMSEHVIRIIPDSKKLNPYYLMAILRTKHIQETIKRGVFGSVIDEITPEFIGNIDIPLPPKAELARLAKAVESAENSRQAAIDGITSTVTHLNQALRAF